MALTVPARLADRVRGEFAQFISQPGYPCIGARSAVRRGGCRVAVYPAMGTADATAALSADLGEFARGFAGDAHAGVARADGFTSFAAVFVEPAPATEALFEQALWAQLSRLSDADAPNPWASDASDDPDDPHFAFSFARVPFFVIGLHAHSSRLARRFSWPALVFNPHAQFRRLRAEGRFEKLRQTIRARDVALQGDVNPNLADAGERSEARQYSGRVTGDDWRCPFHQPRD